MKTIIRLISVAFCLFAATACNLTEINNPDDPNNNGSGKKEYSITAKIIQTRVLYTDGAVLKQEWEEDDRLIGYYKLLTTTDAGTVAQPVFISFTVKEINSDGSANLELKDGTLPEDGTTIALIYDPYGDSELSNGELTVDLSTQSFDIGNQSGTVLPAFMSASAVYTKAGGAEFVFQNDCAIIEVDGIYKTGITTEGQITSVSSIKIENVIASGSYTFNSSEGKFSLSGNSTGAIKVSCDRTLDWESGALDKPVFLAVIPTEENDERTIDVTFFNTQEAYFTVPSYGTTAFDAGKCYVIYPKDMVAKTSDNRYFTTVTAAFENASIIYKEENSIYNSAEKNIVTLLKDCGLAGIDTEGKPVVGGENPIIINGYDVTLDLNGKTLELDDEECFNVDNSFTIEDSGETGGITSSGFGMIKNTGEVNIKGGTLYSDFCSVVENQGTLNIEDGNIRSDEGYTIENSGEANVFGGKIYCKQTGAVSNTGTLNISGGDITSDAVYEDTEAAITSLVGKLNIDGDCTITSTAYLAIDVPGGEFTMSDGYVSGKAGGIQLTDGSTGEITGGTIESKGDEEDEETEDGYALYIENSTCTISGGTIKSESTMKPAVYCFTGVDKQNDFNTDSPNLIIQWNNGSSASDVSRKVDPLIVSNAGPTENDRSYGPISIKNTEKDDTNYAVVIVSGGYLYSNDDACYSKAEHSSLLIPDGCYFYTNEASTETEFQDAPHYFDFGLSENNLVEVPFKTVSIDYYSYHFAYKIIPGYPGTALAPVEIGGITWAPVNCGYDENHPYGLLYQWGRKYGQGYDDEEGEADLYNFYEFGAGQLSTYPDTDISNKNKFYYSVGETYWYAGTDPASKYLWDKNGHEWEVISLENVEEYYPEKSDYDPCPDGWRIPSAYEFYILAGKRYDGADYKIIAPDDEHPTGGAVFYHQVAGINQEELFLPAAGMRNDFGEATDRGVAGYYWTSSVYEGDPWNLTFNSIYTDIINSFFVYGCSIRCVKDE